METKKVAKEVQQELSRLIEAFRVLLPPEYEEVARKFQLSTSRKDKKAAQEDKKAAQAGWVRILHTLNEEAQKAYAKFFLFLDHRVVGPIVYSIIPERRPTGPNPDEVVQNTLIYFHTNGPCLLEAGSPIGYILTDIRYKLRQEYTGRKRPTANEPLTVAVQPEQTQVDLNIDLDRKFKDLGKKKYPKDNNKAAHMGKSYGITFHKASEGWTRTEIGEELGLSRKTVEKYMEQLEKELKAQGKELLEWVEPYQSGSFLAFSESLSEEEDI